jgi:hypothetical protein
MPGLGDRALHRSTLGAPPVPFRHRVPENLTRTGYRPKGADMRTVQLALPRGSGVWIYLFFDLGKARILTCGAPTQREFAWFSRRT